MRKQRWILAGLGSATLAMLLAAGFALLMIGSATAAEDPTDEALERTRDQVRMLDLLYKNAIVAIDEAYKPKPPAIKVAQRVFDAMKESGWHEVRLVDVTGAPIVEENAPNTDFEKVAAEQILAGEPYFDQVVGSGDDRRLLAATVVPAVRESCANCHGVEKGDLIGFVSYDVPVK